PWAYRVFFRQVGIDPDEHRTPVEAIALERMRAGGFPSRNLLDDALLIATVETSVPLVALDDEKVEGPLGLRLSEPDERLGGDGRPLSTRQVVIADAERSVGVLFADLAEGRGVHPHTRRMRIAAVQVKGVPDVSVEEALWILADGIRLEGPLARRAARAVAGRARGAARRAGRSARAQPPGARRPHLRRGAQPPPDRGDAARAGAPQVDGDPERGHRRARLQVV